MASHPDVQVARDVLTDDALRVALLLGLATVPFTVILSWGTVSSDVYALGFDVRGEPILLGGLIAGYYYNNRPTGAKRAGIAVGLAASLGLIILTVVNAGVTIGSLAPVWAITAVMVTAVILVLGIGLSVLFAIVGAVIGDGVRSRIRRWRGCASPRSL